jgi:hypothetical protein
MSDRLPGERSEPASSSRPGRSRWDEWQKHGRWELVVPVRKLVEWFNWIFKRR